MDVFPRKDWTPEVLWFTDLMPEQRESFEKDIDFCHKADIPFIDQFT